MRHRVARDIHQPARCSRRPLRGVGERPDADPVITDNVSICTVLDTNWESNGMSEAFASMLKRDCESGANPRSAAAVLEQVPAWIVDYNAAAPHSALGFHAPRQYRAAHGLAKLSHESGYRARLTGPNRPAASRIAWLALYRTCRDSTQTSVRRQPTKQLCTQTNCCLLGRGK